MFLASSLIKTQLKWWTVHVLTKKYWRFSLCNISNSLNMILPKVENNHDEVWMIFLFGKKYRVFESFLLLENIYLVFNVLNITLKFTRSKTTSRTLTYTYIIMFSSTNNYFLRVDLSTHHPMSFYYDERRTNSHSIRTLNGK